MLLAFVVIQVVPQVKPSAFLLFQHLQWGAIEGQHVAADALSAGVGKDQ